MSTLPEIKPAVRPLPPDELTHFRQWVIEFGAPVGNERFERGAAEARLDRLDEDSLPDSQARRCPGL